MNVPNPKITTGALPASRKIYVEGVEYPDIRVPMREISTHPTAGEAPLPVYDSSGPYTEPNILTDIRQGLPPLRRDWIMARGDIEEYNGREGKTEDNGFAEGDRLAEGFSTRLKPFPTKSGSELSASS